MENKIFRTKIDIYSFFVTFISMLLLIVLIYMTDKSIRLVLIITLSLSIIYVLYYFPLKFKIDSQKITIYTLFRNINIYYSDIVMVKDIETTSSFTVGTKGFFGFLGKTMGGVTSYSTSLRDNIYIEYDKSNKILISPEKIELFKEIIITRTTTNTV